MPLKPNDPKKAAEYFRNKMAFTTGPAEVKHLMDTNRSCNLIDVRRKEDYDKGHIPGAISVPKEDWGQPKGLSGDKPNIVYCYTVVCHLAAAACRRFAEMGYPVMELEGGFEAWKDYEYDVEGGDRSEAA